MTGAACSFVLVHLFVLAHLAPPYPMPVNFSDIKSKLRPVQPFQKPLCGNGICICNYEIANCSYSKLDYIPWLPPDVRRLRFSANPLPAITRSDFFKNATNITWLEMNFNGLTQIGPDVFRPIKNLSVLDLSRNNLAQANLTTIVSIRTLRALMLEGCNLQTLSGVHFDTPYLEILSLIVNSFRILNFTVLAPLQNLKRLNISLNNESMQIFTDSMPSLEVLHIRKSKMFACNLKTCRHGTSLFPRLRELNLAGNSLESLNHPTEICLPNLELLDMRGNKFTFLFNAGRLCRPFFELFLVKQSTAEGKKLSDGTIDGKTSNESVVHDNSPNPNTPSRLTKMFLSLSTISSIEGLEFCTNITELELDNNNLGFSFSNLELQTPRSDIFLLELKELRRLSLAGNKIREINDGWFRNFSFLETVDLSYNFLTSLPDGAFDSLPNLVNINMKGNFITVVRQTTFSAYLLNNLKHFDITNNPIHCSCDLRWFQRWYAQNGARLYYNPYNAKCKNLPETAIMDYFVADQACLWSRETSIFIIIMVSLLFSLMTLCSWLYRYRWHIRLALFEAFPGRQDRLQRLQNQNFQFDVFVSYASEDLDWVRAHLMPQLEEGMGVRLCVHERDFIPGKNIVDNISDCVDESKKLMMIFSPHFARSPWCQFELAFCLTHVLEQGDALLVVLLRDVEARELTPAMTAVLKTMTYIEWENGNDVRESFWRRILIALREILTGV